MSRRSACLSLLLLAAGAPALAQDIASRIPPDATVELTTLGLIQSRLKGQVRAIDSSGIRFTVTRLGSTAYLPWANVQSLHWTSGRSHRRGLLEGAAMGLIFGASTYVNAYPFNLLEGDPNKPERIRQAKRAAISVAFVITSIGLVAGSTRWHGMPLPRSSGNEVALHLHPSDEVRVESTLGRISGTNAFATDSLRFTTVTGPVALPWRNVGDLQVRAGKNRVRGLLYGAAIGLGTSVVGEGYTNIPRAGWIANVALGSAAGYRYLSPEGWVSLPQPRR